MLRRVENDEANSAMGPALMLLQTATIRSGIMPQESANFADNVDKLIRQQLSIRGQEPIEEEEVLPEFDVVEAADEDQ